jgi:hypothetical protein
MKNQIHVERIQTGMCIEKRMVKVLKALAEYLDMTLGDLIEGIVLFCSVFPGLLLGFISGAFLDRYSRKAISRMHLAGIRIVIPFLFAFTHL